MMNNVKESDALAESELQITLDTDLFQFTLAELMHMHEESKLAYSELFETDTSDFIKMIFMLGVESFAAKFAAIIVQRHNSYEEIKKQQE